MKTERITVALDFDGVLSDFSSGWKGARDISDPPVEGVIPWLHILLLRFQVVIFSARIFHWGGKRAMKKWLHRWGMTYEEIDQIKFAYQKPDCQFLLDDRVVQFRGKFPTHQEIIDFRPWHGKDIW